MSQLSLQFAKFTSQIKQAAVCLLAYLITSCHDSEKRERERERAVEGERKVVSGDSPMRLSNVIRHTINKFNKSKHIYITTN